MQIAKPLSMRRVWDPVEWVIGALITAGAVYLHWVNFRQRALWRDEAGVVRIATLPTHVKCGLTWPESCRFCFPPWFAPGPLLLVAVMLRCGYSASLWVC